jgi:HAD superfamily hydrolase (TIGR01509 family)
VQDLFERRGLDFTPQHKHELVGTSAEIAGGILERRLGEPGRAAELIDELNELVVAELEHGVEAMLGAADLLHRLKRRGTPIGLVSNSPLPFVQRSLEIVGFVDHFDVVLSAHEVTAPKPAPDPYLEACHRLGVEPGPAVIALEDSPTGVAAARAAGLTVIGVPSLDGIELLEAHVIADSLLDAVVTRHLQL